ncbi:MAG TPA: hypothetical protein VFG73_09300 [Rhodanobacteraceae bacterium]|nr:hypothetical protein [Rhodanobacteraceae bacterium]
MAIVFIPGIKGSELVDSYPLGWPVRWSLEDMVVGDVVEDPSDFRLVEGRYDACDGHWMRPFRIIRYAYGGMLDKLRAWKAPEPLYVHTYDWRKPLELSAARLCRFADEVQGRERAAGRDAALSFVTHSMGGLLLRSALGLRNPRQPFAGIDRVVFIAPPFRGAIGAPYALVVGEKDGLFGTDEDYRKLARTFPSVYQMTPSWREAALDEAGKPVDLFDAANWQANVRDGGEFSARFLGDAEAFVRGRAARHGGTSSAPMLGDAALARAADKVLVLCGAGIDTPRSFTVQTTNTRNPNWFDFANTRQDTRGDGRVHFLASAVKGVTLAAYADAGDHALLCRDERVTSTVSLWLQGERALKMTRRQPQHSVARPGRRYFEPWGGRPDSFANHVV